jgi:hypothetical protein
VTPTKKASYMAYEMYSDHGQPDPAYETYCNHADDCVEAGDPVPSFAAWKAAEAEKREARRTAEYFAIRRGIASAAKDAGIVGWAFPLDPLS